MIIAAKIERTDGHPAVTMVGPPVRLGTPCRLVPGSVNRPTVENVGGFKWSCRHRARQQIIEDLDRLAPVQRFAGPAVQLCGDSIKFFLRVQGQIGSLGEVLAEKPVGVLVAATLPRGVGVTEVGLS